MNEVLHLNFFDFELFHFGFLDVRVLMFQFSFYFSQYDWWIVQCNECTTTQIGAGVLGSEHDSTLNFLEFDLLLP